MGRCLTVILLLATNLVWAQHKTRGTDSLVVEKVMIDVGEVQAGDTVVQAFVLTNYGSSDVKVEGVTKSCTCTAAKIDKKLIKPGESARVTLTVDTKGKSGRFLVDGVLIANTRQRFYKMIVRGLIL